jgi:hypothetical protein
MAGKRRCQGVLFEGQYRRAKAKGECPNTRTAVLIDGKDAGGIFYLCLTEKCDVHNRVTQPLDILSGIKKTTTRSKARARLWRSETPTCCRIQVARTRLITLRTAFVT